jgi:hypothetical protein
MSAALLSMQACSHHPAGQDISPANGQALFIDQPPPSSKDAIHVLNPSADVALSVHGSCSGVGPELPDQSVGEFVSGFLAELDDEQAVNTIDAAIRDGHSYKEPGWVVRVMIGHSRGENVWRWGVEYFVRGRDGLLPPPVADVWVPVDSGWSE